MGADTTHIASPAMRIAIVTNIPAPYRVPVYNQLALAPGIVLHVFYCCEREPDRHWDLPDFEHDHTFLKQSMYDRTGRFIHNNLDIFGKLKAFLPDVVVTTGYNPTHLYAFAYTRLYKCQHVAMTDGTDISEAGLSKAHQLVRKFVLARSGAFISASNGGRRLFQKYGVDDQKIYFSPLCANTTVGWSPRLSAVPMVDLIFSGRLVNVKNVGFFISVAHLVALQLNRRISVAILGSGPLEQVLRVQAAQLADTVNVHFAGYVSQKNIPHWFLGAKLFLFPTLWDPWGIVANEACMAGLPTLVSPHAGVANELIKDGINGFVLPLDLNLWATTTANLLKNPARRAEMAAQARIAVAPYNFDNAALGIESAARRATARRVVCIQRRLTHYRLPLFELLRSKLREAGIDLVLVYGNPTATEQQKNDSGSLPWGVMVPCRYWLGGRLCWQDAHSAVKGADLVVVTQENKLLFNLLYLFRRPKFKTAFWGHGANMQSTHPHGVLERFKRWTSSRVDWWFGYTQMTADQVEQVGFPPNRITVLNNAIDTTELARQREAITQDHSDKLRTALGFGSGPVGVFIGSLYADKQLEFLTASAELIRQQIPDFHLLFVGDGPQRDYVANWCAHHPWAKFVGPQFGADKVAHLALAQIMMNPGLVGLGILDSFVCGVPMVTTDCGLHSPEIEYLKHGVNGVMTDNNVQRYAASCADLLQDPIALLALQQGCFESATEFTVENMATRFTNGIVACLARPRFHAEVSG